MKEMTANSGQGSGLTRTLVLVLVCVVVMALTLALYMGDAVGLGMLLRGSPDLPSYSVKIIPKFDASNGDSVYDSLPKDAFSYMTIIDAGSSGCRAHVYRYGKLGDLNGKLYVIPKHNNKKIKPGLSSFASKPLEAGASLSGLVEFVKFEIPESLWSTSPIMLMATAGLRMLPAETSEEILQSVREFLGDSSKSPFLFRNHWARIITGNEEGGYGWIAFNYLKQLIGPKRSGKDKTFMVIEMGGASAQVSQMAPTREEADEIPIENRFVFSVDGEMVILYTHSYLGYGAEQGREGLNSALLQSSAKGKDGNVTIKDPCLYSGYSRDAGVKRKEVYEGPDGNIAVQGSSTKSNKCTSAVAKIFNKDTGSCPGKGPYSFNCVSQPDFVRKSSNVLLFENFYYVSSALGLLPNGKKSAKITPKQLGSAASDVCGEKWDDVQAKYPLDKQPKDANVKWCFSSSFSKAFLTTGLGFSEDKSITVQQEVDGSEIEWALGAAYRECADLILKGTLR